ncbi:MAG TPA: hypothetical protein VKT73_05190 [Xanthobacteraceae bacterium]|nr:hypothetical protein [Xanthobacteraceae bacterium]
MRISLLWVPSAVLGLLLLSACAGTNTPAPTEPVAATPGTAAQRSPLTGPPGCTKPIAEYEALVDRDVTTGYLSQSVYDRINQEIAAGPRPACAAGRDADARGQLARIRTSHGYR